jgi:hypothetical protein
VTAMERLRTTLAAMSLTAIDARLEALLEVASKEEPSYADFLLEVMSAEACAQPEIDYPKLLCCSPLFLTLLPR